MSVMDCWTFEAQLLRNDSEVVENKDAIKKAYRELYESHRVLKNTLNAISAVLTIN